MNRAWDRLDPDLVLQELAKIVSSPAFQSSPRRRDLLSWLVRLTLDNRGAEISERAIAAAVFEKAEDFEPTEDAIVRVEFSRLRASLDAYYSREGHTGPVQISIPKRTYAPEFLIRIEDVGAQEIVIESAIGPAPADPPKISRLAKRSWLAVASAALLVVVCGVTLKLASGEWHAPWGRPGIPEFQQVTLLPGRQIHPSLSPNHTLVAFSWDEENGGNFQLFIKPVERMGVTRLTAGPGASRSPAWSPDGNSIAFLRRLPNLGQEVRLIPAKGGEERVLTTIRTVVQGIAWTPDSRYLIVPDGAPGKLLALFLVSIATGERHRLTEYGSFLNPTSLPMAGH